MGTCCEMQMSVCLYDKLISIHGKERTLQWVEKSKTVSFLFFHSSDEKPAKSFLKVSIRVSTP